MVPSDDFVCLYVLLTSSCLPVARRPGITQGGFAKCYELTEIETNRTWAGKIVEKKTLIKYRAKEKVGPFPAPRVRLDPDSEPRVCASRKGWDGERVGLD